MAWLEVAPSGQYQIGFRFGNRRFKKSLRTASKHDAQAACLRIEENIRLVEQGRMTIPSDANVATFLLSDGRVETPIRFERTESLGQLISRYLDAMTGDVIEDNSLATIGIHVRHIQRHIGRSLPITKISPQVLQKYIKDRSKEPGRRGRRVSPTTIRKELTTLASIWNWGTVHGCVDSAFPNRGLKYPKGTDKPPFHSWAQISRMIGRGNLTAVQIQDLWDSLYLSSEQVGDVIDHVSQNARHSFLLPMIHAAAHTGCRRSELLRAQVDDFDLVSQTLRVREKKRVRGRTTTRVVPLSQHLCGTLESWFCIHPGGPAAFCIAPSESGSTKIRHSPAPITVDESNHHFKHVFHGSKWAVLRGWHVFRHSFASNCALKGIDQRMINEWMGHQTEAMVKRYRHLFPDQQQAAVNSVFT